MTTVNVNTHEFRDGDKGAGKEQNAHLKQQSEAINLRMHERARHATARNTREPSSPLQLESLPWAIVYL